MLSRRRLARANGRRVEALPWLLALNLELLEVPVVATVHIASVLALRISQEIVSLRQRAMRMQLNRRAR